MLKFFRRIRKRLVGSGNIRNYSLYAIGEIVLVVIGILIALQFNNWNENKKENAIARGYLFALKGEFQANLMELDRAIEIADTVFSNANRFFLSPERKLPLTDKEAGIAMSKAADLVQFAPQIGVINDIVNSGKTALLRNDTLRNFISSWEGLLKQIQLAEQDLLKGQAWLTEFMIENGNVHKGAHDRRVGAPRSRFEKGNLPLLEMVAFEGYISKVAGNSVNLRDRHYPEFKEKLEQQIAIIDRELE